MAWSEEFELAVTPGSGQKIVGAVVLAADASGNIIHHEAKGATSVDPKTTKPISEDTTFWIASCTKLLTTIAAMQCVEQGKLDLDVDASKLLPELNSIEIFTGWDESTGEAQYKKRTKPITLRLLLTHSAGMAYDFLNPDLAKMREKANQGLRPPSGDILDIYATPLMYEPGESWQYSPSIDWAGKMVERVNGDISLGEYMQKNMFESLGMTSTGFRPDQNRNIKANLCPTSQRSPEGGFVPGTPYALPNPKDDLGGGGGYSSAPDYLKILISLLKNDGKILKPETVDMMFEPQLKDPTHLHVYTENPYMGPMFRDGVEAKQWSFGLGGAILMEDVAGVSSKGAMHWSGLPNCFWWIDRTAGTCGFLGSQLLPSGDPDTIKLAANFRRHIFGSRSQ